MKARTAILMLLLATLLPPPCHSEPGASAPAAAAQRIETATINGRRYLRIGDWARVNNFDVRWLKRDESVQLSRGNSTLVFNKDSRDAEVNGIEVFLSWPVEIK